MARDEAEYSAETAAEFGDIAFEITKEITARKLMLNEAPVGRIVIEALKKISMATTKAQEVISSHADGILRVTNNALSSTELMLEACQANTDEVNVYLATPNVLPR